MREYKPSLCSGLFFHGSSLLEPCKYTSFFLFFSIFSGLFHAGISPPDKMKYFFLIGSIFLNFSRGKEMKGRSMSTREINYKVDSCVIGWKTNSPSRGSVQV
jgi:hypothetical protein